MILLALSWLVNYAGFMKNLYQILIIIIFTTVLTACNRDKALEVENLPVIDLVATHDFETPVPVARLTFVPNSVAPWLGRVILLGKDGKLYSTDIEGRGPKPVGVGPYMDVFGIARNNAPGVFFAINKENTIEAFIESGDQGYFSAMIYSGAELTVQSFCQNAPARLNEVMVLTSDNEKIDLAYSIIGDSNIEQSIKSRTPNQHQSDASVCKADISQPFTLKDDILFMLDPVNTKPAYVVNINDGLSIRGLSSINFMNTTKFNFGGVYNEGATVFVDRDEQRLVFISNGYVTGKLADIFETPTPQ